MTFAVDSSVLLDIFAADREFGETSRQALKTARENGRLVACALVWAETCTRFPEAAEFAARMDQLEIAFEPVNQPVAERASRMWRRFRQSHGGRERILPDFLVGAHALLQADALVTRDRGFYRAYFAGLRVVDPARRRG